MLPYHFNFLWIGKECYFGYNALKIGTSSVKNIITDKHWKAMLTISRKCIFNQSERPNFQNFPRKHAPGPPIKPPKIFLTAVRDFLEGFRNTCEKKSEIRPSTYIALYKLYNREYFGWSFLTSKHIKQSPLSRCGHWIAKNKKFLDL